MKIPEAKAAADKEWNKLQTLPASNSDGRAAHSASLMDLFHLKHAEFANHTQKYIGRVVLRERQGQERRRIQSSIPGTMRVSFSKVGSMISGYHFQTSWYERRRPRRGMSIHANTNVGAPRFPAQPENEWIRLSLLSEAYTVILRQDCLKTYV